MAKLSALASGSIVTMPLYGVNKQFIWLGYNHYGSGEVTLYPNEQIYIPAYYMSVQSVSATQLLMKEDFPYVNSIHHRFMWDLLPYAFPPVVRSSLIERAFTVEGTSVKTSIIQPNIKELGGPSTISVYRRISSSSNLFLATFTYDDTTGSSFPYFSSHHSDSDLPEWVRGTGQLSTGVMHHYPIPRFDTEVTVTSDLISPHLFFYTYEPYHGSGVANSYVPCGAWTVRPSILISGNCEVTGSGTNWTLSRGGGSRIVQEDRRSLVQDSLTSNPHGEVLLNG